MIGVVLVGLGSVGEGVTWNWVSYAQAAFVVAAFGEVVSFRGWLESRRRGPFTLPVSALTLAASAVANVVLVVAADESEVSWLPLFVIIAAVCALVMVVLGEWRRILEYRHVGWREFDASDRRPWPPVKS